jgi:carbon storage regulator
MLCLTRKPGESLKIGPDILVTVTRVHGRKVMLGIDAPVELKISRVELNTRKDKNGKAKMLDA